MSVKLPAVAAAVALAMSGPAAAAVFTYSIPVASNYGGVVYIYPLPQYSGPGVVQKVQLTFEGTTSAWNDVYNFDFDTAPYLAPAMDISWSMDLVGPSPNFPFVGSVPIHTQFPATWVDQYVVTRFTPVMPFKLIALDPDPAAYVGQGWNDFILGANTAAVEATSFSGTLTEVMTISVPEPAVWIGLLAGFSILGASIRRRAAKASCA